LQKSSTCKLYLNLKVSQVASQLLRRLVVNNGQSEAARAFQIEWAIVDERAFFGLALRDSQ